MAPRAVESVTEDASAAPEGAKKAIGWAVGGPVDGYGTILHTVDGGQSWVRQGTPDEIPNGPLSGAAAVDAREAWVVGSDSASGVLLHTRDGGQHWYSEGNADDLNGSGLIAVSAVDLYTAWAVGANGLILHTTDGGKSWVRQGAGRVPSVGLNGVYAADASHAWAVGPNEEGKAYGTIVRTADGGETWSKVPYSITHNSHPSAVYLITIHGANANDVWLWAVSRSSMCPSQRAALAPPIRRRRSATMTSRGFRGEPENRVADADGGVIWRSVNGGKAWTERSPKGAGYAFRVWALDKNHAWATTGDTTGHGQVLYTADGGKNWTSQNIPANPQMWGISFVK